MTPEDGPSREILVAQVEALKDVVRRQKLYIGSMRASHFWKLRDAFFAFRRRFGNGIEPLPVPSAADLATESGGFGDPYQLYRMRERRSDVDLDWLRKVVPLLAIHEPIEVIVDARSASPADMQKTKVSLDDQIYPYSSLRVVTELSEFPVGDMSLPVCALEAGDVLEPDALLALAVEFQSGADVVYTDEDRLDGDGIPREPSFKPCWSPETALTRDYVGRLCAIRGTVLAAAGGLNTDHGAATWYDALLRVTESTGRVEHVPRVLVHRRSAPMLPAADAVAAIRRALARRGERGEVQSTPSGIEVRFAVPDDEHVTVIIPTRDRADLLERCLRALFDRTTHPSFDVLVVDNGSREAATHALFERWRAGKGDRFRVVADPQPFNYSRLNNRGVAATDATYVVLLNNDTEIIAPDWMTAMLGQARRAHVGAVGAMLLYADGTIQHAGVLLGDASALSAHAFRFMEPSELATNGRLTLDTNYLAVTGACLMIARSKYLEVGGLDEELAVSYNDVDLCLKLRAAGYHNVMVPRARLYHYESKSRGHDDTKRKVELAIRERETIRQRWPQWSRRDPYNSAEFSVRK